MKGAQVCRRTCISPRSWSTEVVIQDALRHLSGHEAWAFFGISQLECGAGLHDAQDANQAGLESGELYLLLGPGVFVDVPLVILVQVDLLSRQNLWRTVRDDTTIAEPPSP